MKSFLMDIIKWLIGVFVIGGSLFIGVFLSYGMFVIAEKADLIQFAEKNNAYQCEHVVNIVEIGDEPIILPIQIEVIEPEKID